MAHTGSDTAEAFKPGGPEGERWTHTRQRRRIQEGRWQDILVERIREHLSVTRQINLGRPVISVNLQKSIASQLAVLYDQKPTIKIADVDPEAESEFVQMLETARALPIMSRNCESTIALREGLITIGWSPSQNVPTVRMVTPDVIVAETAPGDPLDLRLVKEWRIRTWTDIKGRTRADGFWDVWDIRDMSAPSFTIVDADGDDVTARFLGDEKAGQSYPYLWEDGTPFLPWVIYHAEDTGRLWNPYEWMSIFEGTLDVAVLWSLFFHSARDAAWIQKWGLDVEVDGAVTTSVDGGAQSAKMVETAPTSILMFRTKTTTQGTGSLGDFSAPIEPAKFAQSVIDYTQTIVSHIGIHPADLERTGGASSGYAIQLKRSAQRRLGLKFEPQFRRGDLELLPMMARVSNIFAETSHPLEGYSITYHPIEDTVDEQAAEFDYWQKLVDANQLDVVTVHQRLNPSMARDDALVAVINIEAMNRLVSASAIRESRAVMALREDAEREAALLVDEASAVVEKELE